MAITEPSFTIGIEEEYLLVDLESRDLVSDPPEAFMRQAQEAVGDHVTAEFLRCQVEVGTPVCKTIGEAREALSWLRTEIARVARRHGMAPIAAGTHPFAQWDAQRHTDKARYNELAESMQVVARRMLICGMHVHVGIEDDALRTDIFNQVSYFLPHLLALSTSSPFWRGAKTGLGSYRLSIFSEMPRTGVPETFNSPEELRRTIDVLVATGIIEDASKIWWDVRPSVRFPTLELRVTDACPRIDDTLGIAALFACLCRMLYRLRRDNQRWRAYARLLIDENRWLAQKSGVKGALIDFGRGTLVPYPQLLEEILALVAEDAAALGCQAELAHLRRIAAEGTSADRQVATYDAALAEGLDSTAALKRVVDLLIAESTCGIGTDISAQDSVLDSSGR